ncbi:kinase-like domain-containing protein [Hypoxylon cercidicola]|nr:kinase-like domain-containing protein [Hypoxylon cercidicola]
MEPDDDDFDQPIVLSRQGGCLVRLIGPGVVSKRGSRVTKNEAVALELVKDQTDVPVPKLYSSVFFVQDGEECGSLLMELVEGTPLNHVWDGFDDDVKSRICGEIWNIVAELQKIPRPKELSHLYQCGADGSPSTDVLIKDLHSPPTPILDDDALRDRIYERYFHYFGRLYEGTLPDMLPRSSVSVFTHGDLAPRNIMVQGSRITGIVDWENAGWYPDYWEYANIMKPSRDRDWMSWMDRTKPKKWDINGIEQQDANLQSATMGYDAVVIVALNQQEAKRRIERRGEPHHLDYFEQLCPADAPEPDKRELEFMEVIAVQLLDSGYEPISSQFQCTLMFLLHLPESYKRVVKEIRNKFTNYDEITSESCARLKYLYATLMETLRITVIGENGMLRTGPGAVVDGHYIKRANARGSAPGMGAARRQTRLFIAKVLWSLDAETAPGQREMVFEGDFRQFMLWEKPSSTSGFVRW